MATNYPSSLDNSTTLPAESANTPLSTNHVTAHQNIQDALEAVEAKIGVDSSAVATSLDYLVKNASSSNPGHKHTLANGATDVTATAAEVNKLAGTPAGLTSTEIGYLDGVTSAIQTQIDTKAADSAVVKLTGDQTVAGIKTFSSDPLIPDEAYGSGWNGVLEPPTKNAVYDKIETLANFDKIPNTDVPSVAYQTFQLMPVVGATTSVITNGWTKSGHTYTADTGGGGRLGMGIAVDGYTLAQLPSIIATQDELRFNDIGANEIRIKHRFKAVTLGSGERIGFGLTNQAGDLSQLDTYTTQPTIRFLYQDTGTGDKLWAVNSNGSAATSTDITGALTLTNFNVLELVITSTSIKFYVNGTLVATHTTNIPTSGSVYVGWGTEYNGTMSGSAYLNPIFISLPTGL